MKVRTTTSGILILILSSCASIINGPTQLVSFSSQPTGARIIIDGKDRGKTPQLISLRRMGREVTDNSQKQAYAITIELDGYYPYQTVIKRQVDALIIGNIIFGVIIGIMVDAATGAMYKLTPDQIMAQLNNNSTGMIDLDKDRLYVAVTMKVESNWEKIGQLKSVE